MNINLTEATIAKLDLQPDDVIVVRVTESHRNLTTDQAQRIIAAVRQACGEHEVLVLPYDLDLEIVRPDEVPA